MGVAPSFFTRDMIRALSAQGPDCLQRPVSESMTRERVITCRENDTLDGDDDGAAVPSFAGHHRCASLQPENLRSSRNELARCALNSTGRRVIGLAASVSVEEKPREKTL